MKPEDGEIQTRYSGGWYARLQRADGSSVVTMAAMPTEEEAVALLMKSQEATPLIDWSKCKQ